MLTVLLRSHGTFVSASGWPCYQYPAPMLEYFRVSFMLVGGKILVLFPSASGFGNFHHVLTVPWSITLPFYGRCFPLLSLFTCCYIVSSIPLVR